MWVSLLHHVCNTHSWEGEHDFSEYTMCAHQALSVREEVSYKWLERGGSAHSALKTVVLDPKLLADVPFPTGFKHSGNLEVFHSLLLKYCPKRLSFSYEGMYARTQLAVLDHNSGINRNQATTKIGTPRVKQQYSKVSDQWVVKDIREKKDNSYIDEIKQEIKSPSEENIRKNKKLENVPRNIAPKENPGKNILLSGKKSRFSKPVEQ